MNLSIICLAVAGWLATTWLAFRWGLRSHKEAARLKARNDALAAIDSIVFEIPKQKTLPHLFTTTRDGLKQATFKFSSQVSECRRFRIEQALDNYQALHLTAYPVFPSGIQRYPSAPMELDAQAVEQERRTMLEMLKLLRDEISGG